MVSFSKFLDLGLRHAKCHEVYHAGETCFQFQFGHSLSYLTTVTKFLLPVAVIPLLTKGKNARVWNILTYYAETIITGYVIAQSLPIALCGTRALCGQFSKSNIMFIPTIIATWPVLFTTPKVARFYATSIFQVVLEAVIRNKKYAVCRTLYRSKLIQTILFMTCSAFILHSVQKYNMKIVWIIKAIPSPKEHGNNKCVHDGPCVKFCLKEVAKTLLLGIPLDLYKTVSTNPSKGTSFINNLIKKLFHLHFPTTLFFSSYMGIYKFTSCLLTRIQGGNPQVRHAVAAFFGGISFYFLPRLTMLCYGTAVCVEIIWNLFMRYNFENDNTRKFMEFIKKIPFHRLLTMAGTGIIVHLYYFQVEYLCQLGLAMIKAKTGNRSHHMINSINNYLKKLDKSAVFKHYL